jgi:transcription factor SPT20
VEVHDHKSVVTQRQSSQNAGSTEKSDPISIHKSSPWLTPSPWVPYRNPVEHAISPNAETTLKDESRVKSQADKDKENMPAPGQSAENPKSTGKQAKIITVVLHPTPLSQFIDLSAKAGMPANPHSKRDANGEALLSAGMRPSTTPLIAIPSTPILGGMEPPAAKRQKREKMQIDLRNVYAVESQIAQAITAPLYLESATKAMEAVAILEALAHPDHCAKVPPPKTRKKTVAEMAAEESAAADEESYMLIMDERHSSKAGGAGGGSGEDGQVGGSVFEPRFERFKAIESIKLQVIERKKREKLVQAEQAKKEEQEAEQREKAKQEEARRALEEQSRLQAQLRQSQQHAQRQAIQRAAAVQRQQQANQAAAGILPNAGVSGAMGGLNNGMGAQQRFLQQQALSQAPMSSPVVRNATPHNASSPMVGQAMVNPMQPSNSSMGGSPPRPGSVVPQNPQMTPLMANAMRPQNSQQSQGGTPRVANATPNMSHNMPNVGQTPRMGQSSPMGMGQQGQMGMMPNQMTPAQMQQTRMMAQQQQERIRQQAVAQAALQGSPMNSQQMTPQQQMLMQQQLQQMQGQNMMGMNGMGMNAAQMRAMQAMQQGSPQGFMGQNRNPITPQMMQQAQHQAALQAQQHGMQQGQQAVNPQSQVSMQMRQQIAALANRLYQQQLPNVVAQYGGNPPPEALAQFRQQCNMNAMAQARARMAHQQQQLRQAQGQMMANGGQVGMGMPMNMGNMGNMNMNLGGGNINMNGMGMQRPNGI